MSFVPQLLKDKKKDRKQATMAGLKMMVNELDKQQCATFKVICHMFRFVIRSKGSQMDSRKLGMCVSAQRPMIQGPLALMMEEFDAIFGDT